MSTQGMAWLGYDTYEGKPRLGSGVRFRRLADHLASQPGVRDPKALVAAIRRKKYGNGFIHVKGNDHA